MALEVLLRRGALEKDDARSRRVRARARRDARAAASRISSAAASIATRPTSAGSCRTSRRCSTTTRCCCASTSTRGARPATTRFAATAREIARLRAPRDDRRPRAASTRRRTPTAKGEEGKFFVWTPSEVDASSLGDDAAAEVALLLLRRDRGGELRGDGATVLSRPCRIDDLARRSRLAPTTVRGRARARAREDVRRAREAAAPFRDEKILASWNALMIGALADAGAALGDAALHRGGRRRRSPRRGDARAGTGPGAHVDAARQGRRRRRGRASSTTTRSSRDAALDLYEATGEPSLRAACSAIARRG